MPDPVQDSNPDRSDGNPVCYHYWNEHYYILFKNSNPFYSKKKKQKVSVLIAVVQDSNPGRSDTSPVR